MEDMKAARENQKALILALKPFKAYAAGGDVFPCFLPYLPELPAIFSCF